MFGLPVSLLVAAVSSLLIAGVIAPRILRDPRDAARVVFRGAVHLLYRLDKDGVDRLEAFAKAGPGVVVANHVSYVDALIVGALAPRPMRFVMDHRIFKLPLIGAFFRFARAIPIAPAKEDAALKEEAFAEVRRALADGDTVCIFPEGRLTRDGETLSFRAGIERILAEHPAPVLPVGLTGLWGSWLSYAHGAPGTTSPRRFRASVGVHVGHAIPVGVSVDAATLEAQVRSLITSAPVPVPSGRQAGHVAR